MSDTLNTADSVLAATSPRLLPAANAAIILDCSTPVFHINTSSVADPTSISFVARFISMEGTVTFSSSGCTLSSVSGNTCALLASDMAGLTATVTASLTYRGTSFSTTVNISKVVDGATGGTGSRGAGSWYASGTSWVDATADAATPGANITDDLVTITNGSTFAETRKWSGTAWVVLTAALNGNIIINGSLTDAQLTAIAAAKITGQITTTQITNNSITTGKIAAAAVTTSEIAADTITAGNIAANAITSSELATGAVIAGKITAGTIVAADIAASTITGGKIAANTITAANITAATITATEIAANTITASKIVAGTITATEIAANTITASKIAAGTITATEIAASTITAGKMNVTDLSAISTNFGSVSIASGGYLKSGQTAYDTGVGFWLGSVSGTPKFSIGDSSGNKLTWDGTTLSYTGSVVLPAFSATITGTLTTSFSNTTSTTSMGTLTASVTGGRGTLSYLWIATTSETSPQNRTGLLSATAPTSSATGVSAKVSNSDTSVTGFYTLYVFDQDNRVAIAKRDVTATFGTPP